MKFTFSLLFVLFAAVNCQVITPVRDYRYNPNYYYDESPKPYNFHYNALLEDGVGQSSRTEAGDATGRVQGSYSLTNDEGHTRIVDYIADQDGFRATVRTNEPGTDNKNPADVVIESNAAYSNAPYRYSQVLRRPIVTPAAAQPVVPVEPEVVPENIVQPVVQPVRPTIYRRPVAYANRNNQYRPGYRNPFVRY